MSRLPIVVVLLLLSLLTARANTLIVAMDETQRNHLKAYGITFWVLNTGYEADWLLNYRGGAFAFDYSKSFENEMLIRGVGYEVIPDAQYTQIKNQILSPEVNMDVVHLEKAPRVAVYSPKTKQPWDDAVTMVLTYAEIPYTVIFDDEIMGNQLSMFDWLHLHHEDFTGQYGKFYRSYGHEQWYKDQQASYEESARKHGFKKVSELKLATVKKIREFVIGGGYLFAMCAATDTYDIALAAEGTDICANIYDGDGMDPQMQQKLNYANCFAFQNFTVSRDPMEYEYSNIDNQLFERGGLNEKTDFFTLFPFSAKWDPIPTILTQCHSQTIHGFLGQTTGFKKKLIKPDVVIMGENRSIGEAKFIHGTQGRGMWTFYGGHDPEDYQHLVHEEPTDLALYPNSPGFRLILNNILFPAARKKKPKT